MWFEVKSRTFVQTFETERWDEVEFAMINVCQIGNNWLKEQTKGDSKIKMAPTSDSSSTE